jgi:hypothetical protein
MNDAIQIIFYEVNFKDNSPNILTLHIEANTCKLREYFEENLFDNLALVYFLEEDNSWIEFPIVSLRNFSLIARFFFNLPSFETLKKEARAAAVLSNQGDTNQQAKKKSANPWELYTPKERKYGPMIDAEKEMRTFYIL